MNRVIIKSDKEYIKHLLAANKSQSDFIRQLQEERDVACGANAEYCDEITRLREKLKAAEEALHGLCDDALTAGENGYGSLSVNHVAHHSRKALAKIREE